MRKFLRIDDFGAGCFGLVFVAIVASTLFWVLHG
jgi:hypothetical protein